jgi:hypothetical protein
MANQAKQQRQANAQVLLAENAKLTTQQKLDKALSRGGSAKEVKRLRKLLEEGK